MYVCIYIYIYIYLPLALPVAERARLDQLRGRAAGLAEDAGLDIYIYIYIYIEREREMCIHTGIAHHHIYCYHVFLSGVTININNNISCYCTAKTI